MSSIDDARKALKDNYDSLIKQAVQIKKALQLLESGNEPKASAPPVKKRRKLSPEALRNIRAGVKKRLAAKVAGKKKTPVSALNGN